MGFTQWPKSLDKFIHHNGNAIIVYNYNNKISVVKGFFTNHIQIYRRFHGFSNNILQNL